MRLPVAVFGKIASHNACSNVIEETISCLIRAWVVNNCKIFVMENIEKNLNSFFLFFFSSAACQYDQMGW